MHEDLSSEELHRLVRAYARCWLAHDGCWFLAVEEERGLEEAIRQDERAWARFAPLEARRVMEARRIEPGGGLEAHTEALSFRMYSFLNKQDSRLDGDRLIFKMTECRVQAARRRKGLPNFTCKPVGKTEFSQFAKAVDPRIITSCIYCPPDELPKGEFCAWKFRI